MVAYNPKERHRLKDILTKDPWLQPLNILIETNPSEYKNLEDEYIAFMKEIEQKIKDSNQPNIQVPNKDKGEEKQATKGISSDNKKKFLLI